jgi:hypothetical protein
VRKCHPRTHSLLFGSPAFCMFPKSCCASPQTYGDKLTKDYNLDAEDEEEDLPPYEPPSFLNSPATPPGDQPLNSPRRSTPQHPLALQVDAGGDNSGGVQGIGTVLLQVRLDNACHACEWHPICWTSPRQDLLRTGAQMSHRDMSRA